MRSTTLGWLTSMVMVLPVTADNKWLNSSRPEFRDSINHPSEPIAPTPRSSPMTSANTTAADDRADDDRADLGAGLEDWTPASGSLGMLQGYHQGGWFERGLSSMPAATYCPILVWRGRLRLRKADG